MHDSPNSRRSHLAVEVTDEQVRMLQLARTDDGAWRPILQDRRSLCCLKGLRPLCRERRIAAMVRDMLDSHGRGDCPVVTCLPLRYLQVHTVRLPITPAEQLGAVTVRAARECFGFALPPDQPVWIHAATITASEPVGEEIILLSGREDLLCRPKRWLAGARMVGMDHAPLAAARAARISDAGSGEQGGVVMATVLLERGQGCVCVGDAEGVRYLRRFPLRRSGSVGGRLRLTDALDVDVLAGDVVACLSYCRLLLEGLTVDRAVVCGSLASPQVVDKLARRIPVPCRVLMPWTDGSATDGAWATCAGMALANSAGETARTGGPHLRKTA